jgi:tetratricopeptide (TPR) repeat protein
LLELAGLRPVVIYIDDLQWADRDSLELLDVIMKGSAGLLLVVTLRPDNPKDAVWDAIAGIAATSRSHRLTLEPLSAEEQRALLYRLAAYHPTAGTLAKSAEPLWDDQDSSPLLLVELVRFLDETGHEGPASALRLDEVLSRRVSRLPAEARTLLQATAVAGEPTPYWILAQAGNLAAEAGQHGLMLLRKSRLMRIVQPGADPWITTTHNRVREAVMASISAEARERLHAGLAAALESWQEASVDALAHHWRAAGDREKARTYLVSAAGDAAAKLAFDRAAELYGQAIELGAESDDVSQLLRHMGDALTLAGRSYEAATAYERAAASAPADEALELRRLAADEWLRSGHIKRGFERLAAVVAELGFRYARTRTGAIASLLVQRARLRLRGRHYQTRATDDVLPQQLSRIDTLYAAATTLGFIDHLRGTAIQTYHVLSALDLGEERCVCRALALEYAYYCVSGKSDKPDVEELGAQVLEHARRLGDSHTMGLVLVCWGGAQYFAGRSHIAVKTLRECDEFLRNTRRPVEWERRTAHYMLSLARIATGELSGQMRADDHHVVEAERSNDVYARTMFLGVPGTWSHLAADQPELADRRLDTAMQGWPDDGFYVAGYVQAYGRVMVRIYQGKGEEALAIMDEAMPRIRKLMLHRVPWVSGEFNTLIARAALLVEGDAARRRARKAVRTVARAKMTYTEGVAALLRAALHHRDGDAGAAVDELRRAGKLLSEVQARHLLAASQMRLGGLVGGDQGEELVRQGEAALRACGVKSPERMLELLAPGFGR